MQFIQSIDMWILMFIQNHFTSPLVDGFMVTVTSIGNAGCIWIAIGLILLLSRKYKKYGIMLFVTLAICALIVNLGIKPMVARPRPYTFNDSIRLLIDEPLDYSFPSGHTAAAFASSVIIYYMNKKLGIISYILAATIAFSRLYLFVHFPSDVLAGLIIGVVIAKCVIKGEQAFFSKDKGKQASL